MDGSNLMVGYDALVLIVVIIKTYDWLSNAIVQHNIEFQVFNLNRKTKIFVTGNLYKPNNFFKILFY